jgi:hypothetical protein
MSTSTGYVPSLQASANVVAAKQYLVRAIDVADRGLATPPGTYDGTTSGFVANLPLAASAARTAITALEALDSALLFAPGQSSNLSKDFVPTVSAAAQQVRDGVASLTAFVALFKEGTRGSDYSRTGPKAMDLFSRGAEQLYNARVTLDRVWGSSVLT